MITLFALKKIKDEAIIVAVLRKAFMALLPALLNTKQNLVWFWVQF